MISASKPIRFASLLIGLSSLAATLILVLIREPIPGTDGSYVSTSWALLRYFTILTNFIVSYVLIKAAIRGHWTSFGLLTASTLWISLVGIIYHRMLAGDHNPTGLAALTNHIHHSVVPLGTFLIWLLCRPRGFIKSSAPFYWLIFPLCYTAYMVFRAELLNDQYPYPFSDPTLIGWPKFWITQIVLTLIFLGLGFVIRAASNALPRG